MLREKEELEIKTRQWEIDCPDMDLRRARICTEAEVALRKALADVGIGMHD